jgi:hypothetical protein
MIAMSLRLRLECRMIHAIQFVLFVAFVLANSAANADDTTSAWTALRHISVPQPGHFGGWIGCFLPGINSDARTAASRR